MDTEAVLDTKKDRTSRVDMRLAQSEKSLFERAAASQGMRLTQWATAHLIEDARRDIENAMTTKLSTDAFDAFAAQLDHPMPQPVQELLAKKPVWA